MEKPALQQQDVFPTEEVIKGVLKGAFPAYLQFMDAINSPDLGLQPEWNYFKDGKAWLCKVTHKKKTVFWLSVWEGFFKCGFYFTEKTAPGVYELDVSESLKDIFHQEKPVGRLRPMIINVYNKDQIRDPLKIIEYKKGLK
ncbi:MAG: DUF3788 domain-containing protein [Bacteroidales bacterium]|nr:DUF3788 domain-containing protein [Bacteroidales bacterium]